VANHWDQPREGWCQIVHWIDSGKPGYYAGRVKLGSAQARCSLRMKRAPGVGENK
jgi:hypothetical protein